MGLAAPATIFLALALSVANTAVSQPLVSQVAEPAGEVDIIHGDADRDQLMTLPVRIGEHGPFRFLIDTGSQRTVVSTELATRLGLAPGPKVRIVGIAGTESVESAQVEEVGLGRRTLFAQPVLLLDDRYMGADGIIGLDGLQGQRVLMDFSRNTLAIGDARSLGGNRGYEIVVTARRKSGQLIMTDALIDGVRVAVVIDTGANTSVGNRALQRALRQVRTSRPTRLVSVTGQSISADLGFARKLEIETIGITNLVIAYADAPPFAVLGLDRRPAILLGMRELRLFRRIAIDFGMRKVMFDVPEDL